MKNLTPESRRDKIDSLYDTMHSKINKINETYHFKINLLYYRFSEKDLINLGWKLIKRYKRTGITTFEKNWIIPYGQQAFTKPYLELNSDGLLYAGDPLRIIIDIEDLKQFERNKR